MSSFGTEFNIPYKKHVCKDCGSECHSSLCMENLRLNGVAWMYGTCFCNSNRCCTLIERKAKSKVKRTTRRTALACLRVSLRSADQLKYENIKAPFIVKEMMPYDYELPPPGEQLEKRDPVTIIRELMGDCYSTQHESRAFSTHGKRNPFGTTIYDPWMTIWSSIRNPDAITHVQPRNNVCMKPYRYRSYILKEWYDKEHMNWRGRWTPKK